MRGAQRERRVDWGVRGDVACIALHHNAARRPGITEAARERVRVEVAAEHAQEAEIAFQRGGRAGEALGGERGREHAALGGAPEVEPLHHRTAAGLREFQDSCGERCGNPDGVRGLLRIQTLYLRRGDRRAERPGRSRRMKAVLLVAVLRGESNADHDFRTRDECDKELAPAAAALLRHGERGAQQGRARMRAGIGLR